MGTAASHIYWTLLQHADWNLHIAATSEGLCYVGNQNGHLNEITGWVQKRFPGAVFVRDYDKMRPYSDELLAFLEGKRSAFSMPLQLHGTPFQLGVWHALTGIPYGRTVSYSEVAAQLGKPSSVRAVGSAVGANPLLIIVPCHRVVGKKGGLTGYRGGLDMKAQLLQLEREQSFVNQSTLHA